VIIDSITLFDNPYQFTGRQYDSETGLHYYRARYYNAEIGRFLQPDPIGYNDGMNMYAYVGNNPISFTDPFGLLSTETRRAILNQYAYTLKGLVKIGKIDDVEALARLADMTAEFQVVSRIFRTFIYGSLHQV